MQYGPFASPDLAAGFALGMNQADGDYRAEGPPYQSKPGEWFVDIANDADADDDSDGLTCENCDGDKLVYARSVSNGTVYRCDDCGEETLGPSLDDDYDDEEAPANVSLSFYRCYNCGSPMFTADDGVAHHGNPGEINHDQDADHVAVSEMTMSAMQNQELVLKTGFESDEPPEEDKEYRLQHSATVCFSVRAKTETEALERGRRVAEELMEEDEWPETEAANHVSGLKRGTDAHAYLDDLKNDNTAFLDVINVMPIDPQDDANAQES